MDRPAVGVLEKQKQNTGVSRCQAQERGQRSGRTTPRPVNGRLSDRQAGRRAPDSWAHDDDDDDDDTLAWGSAFTLPGHVRWASPASQPFQQPDQRGHDLASLLIIYRQGAIFHQLGIGHQAGVQGIFGTETEGILGLEVI